MQKTKLSWFLKLMLLLSLAFLYIPLVVLVIYSFNNPSWLPFGAVSRPNGMAH